MKFKYIKHALAGLIMTASGMGNAAVITIGNLTLENAGDIYVTDTVNGVDYIRWDQVKDLNFGQLTVALATGAIYQGLSIVTNIEANNFTNALLPKNDSGCDDLTNNLTCIQVNPSVYDFDEYVTLISTSYDSDTDVNFAYFLNTVGSKNEVGLVTTLNFNHFDILNIS